MLSQKIRPIISVLLLAAVLLLNVSPAKANTEALPEVGSFMDSLMRAEMEELNIPNAAVAIVAGGEVVFLQGYGEADREEGRPVQAENTVFRIGSVSKLFTWTAVMQLVEQGKLDLNADVNEYLDFQIPARLLNGGGSATAPITLAHLMTHTAGFEAYPDEIFRLQAEDLLSLNEYVKKYLPARVFPPGEVAAYSNYSAALAGYIVERVSGQPFAEYVEQHIFAPLGMTQSTFEMPAPAHLAARLARPYRFVNGDYLPGEFEYMQAPEGGMSTTAADMAKFMIANLEDGGGILQPETLQQMHSRQPAAHPALGGMTLGFMEGTFNGRRVLFHGGSTMIFDSGLYLLPEENVGVFITYSGANHLAHTSLFQDFMDRYYPAPEAAIPAPAEGMRERARQFAGEYHQNTRSFTTDEKFLSLTMGVINVAVDEDGYLLITHVGETNRFAEIEPGVYRNLREGRTQDYFGPFRTVVFATDPQGSRMLIADGPMTYSKAPWYGSSSFTFLALGSILLLMLVSLIAWGIGSLIGRIRGKRADKPKGAAAARWVAIAFALATLVLILSILTTGAPDPVYLLPASAFGAAPSSSGLQVLLTWAVICLGAAVVAFSVLAWRKGYWRLPGRIHYTLLSGGALLLMWIFVYWNVV